MPIFDISVLSADIWLLLVAFALLCVLVVVFAVRLSWQKKLQVVQDQLQYQESRSIRALEDAAKEAHCKELQIVQLQAHLENRDEQLVKLRSQLKELSDERVRRAELQVRQEEQLRQHEQQVKLLEETRLRLFKEFELSANKLFESKSLQFSQSSRSSLEQLLKPFRDQIHNFHQRVEDVYHKENSQRNQLMGQIVALQKQAQLVGQEANNLAAALKGDTKVQGSWGEVVLERLLEQSGLQKGREYDTQKTHADDTGKRYKPDVIVHLPEGKDIIIDSKVSVLDFQRYCESESDEDKTVFLKKHVDSLRAHIRGLAGKRYDQLEGVRTLDFVFIFVPVEPAYHAAIQSAPTLFQEAYDKNIVLVGPSSLMVALRTVETLWRYARQNSNAEAIAASAGKLYDQFVIIVEALEEHGRQLDKSCESFQLTRKRLVDGRGNLARRIELLRELGAKTNRTMPEQIKSDAYAADESHIEQEQERSESLESYPVGAARAESTV